MSFVAVRLRGRDVVERHGPYDSRARAWDAARDHQADVRDDRETWAVRAAGVVA